MSGRRWLRLDNAAKIYPAARRRKWSSIFRLSVSLTEDVDVRILQRALDATVPRFPSLAARLRRGVFWYYLEQLEHAPRVQEDHSYPLTPMTRQETRQCAFRILVHKERIALELFHVLADGTGALSFLKTLLAEYLLQKYGVQAPAEHGVLDRTQEPQEEELEDSFQKYAGAVQASRKGSAAWHMAGTPELGGFLHLTCFRLSVRQVLEKAHAQGVSVTTYLCAALMMALQNMQVEQVPRRSRRKNIKLLIPVNLRRLFPSKTLRNFAMYCVPELIPRLGHYSFEEICSIIHHRMALDVTPKYMSTMIATNISSEKLMAVRIIPLFLKNIIMKMIFNAVGERQTCISLSNLGAVTLPDAMKPYVSRFDFILNAQATNPNNCSAISFGDNLCLSFIRNIREPNLERHFHAVLQDLGLTAQVQSNQPD